MKLDDKYVLTDLAANCAPKIRPSVVGTYEFLSRCFNSTFFVYEEENEIKAYMVGFPNIDSEGEEYWIYQVCVHGSLRGKKIGSQLFEVFLKKVEEMGYKRIRSQVTNEHSVNLHEKYGFKKIAPDERGWIMELTF